MSATSTPQIVTYQLSSTAGPSEIALGPDGNMWFLETGTGAPASALATITSSGAVTTYALGTLPLMYLATGPDGNIWITDGQSNPGVTKVTTGGVATTYPIAGNHYPGSITVGSDGNLWFTDSNNNSIDKMTTSGTLTFHPLASGANPLGITSGPSSELWYSEAGLGAIGSMTTSGSATTFPLNISGSYPTAIAYGPDGNLWVCDGNTNAIERVTPSGSVTSYPINGGALTGIPMELRVGPDGNMWFLELGLGSNPTSIMSISTAGHFTNYALSVTPSAIAWGSNNTLWFTEYRPSIVGKIIF